MNAVPALTDYLALTPFQLQGYRRRWVKTSVGQVHVLDAEGSGTLPPLVLLHGFSSAGVHFFPLADKLRRRVRRLILPDMPAHGFSDTPANLSAGALKAGLVEALDAVVDEPAVVFGNSMGGCGAIHHARVRPKRVRGLILCSPTGAAMSQAELARFVRAFDVKSHDDALAFLDRVLARPSPLRQILAWELRRKFTRPELSALLASLKPQDLFRPDEVRTLAPPVLLIWGQQDRILPASHLAFFRDNLPDHARVLTPKDFGHTPFLDDAAMLAEHILHFLGELGPARAMGSASRGAAVGRGARRVAGDRPAPTSSHGADLTSGPPVSEGG
jgi:pimeloyl-ACP methyl ester carboxylesterase